MQPSSQDDYLRRQDVTMFEAIFQPLLDVYFYVKDIDGRWISCNTASLELLNKSKVSEVIGVKEEDFFPKKIAQDIRADDLSILNNAESVLDRVELISNNYGELIWVNTNKIPIFNTDDKVIGIMGVTRPLVTQTDDAKKYQLFSGTIDYIRANLTKTIKISDLANVSNLSENQFRRKFRLEFGLPPQEFILRARLQAAAHLLRGDLKNISVVAMQSGFSDQSYFTRQFKKFFGETPKDYRKAWKSASIS